MKRIPYLLLMIVFSGQCWSENKNIEQEFVSMSEYLPELVLDIRYVTNNNFVGKPVDGYLSAECVLHRNAAKALKVAHNKLVKQGLNFKVFDCYRPQRAVDHFVRWAADEKDIATKSEYYPNLHKSKLIGPYIAAKSGHTRGATIDLTLVRREKGQWVELDMGSAYDLFDPISNTDNEAIKGKARSNRLLLKAVMESSGFSAYDMEWWHFSLTNQPYPDTYFDFPVGK